MDLKKRCTGWTGLAEHTAGDVGLAAAEGIGHTHPALFNPAFLLAVSTALAVPVTPGSSRPCLPRGKGLFD